MAFIRGSRFSDDIDGTSSSDTIEGLEGHDRIWGRGGDDILIGGSGDDDLDGGSGNDRLEGGTGDDLFVVDATGDQVIELADEGIDVVLTSLATYTLGANVEDLAALSSADFHGIGNALDNYLYGYTGDDILDGRGGNDVMFGDVGDDSYFVDESGDEVVEYSGEGIDLVLTSLPALTLWANVEELIFDGAGSFIGTGNSRHNFIEGGAAADRLDGRDGDDVLDGRGGADEMIGGFGSDIFFVDQGGDRIVETSGAGFDRVKASTSFTLTAGASVEMLTTTDNLATAAINLTGNALSQYVYGNAGANRLDGGGGGDTLVGLQGNDNYIIRHAADRAVESANGGSDRVFAATSFRLEGGSHVEILSTIDNLATTAIDLRGNELGQFLFGNAGANRLDGRGGSDILFGLGGADLFAFTTSLGSGNVDRIGDFQSGIDRIELENGVFTGLPAGALAPGAFVTGSAAADADDRIIYNPATGALLFDRDGSGGGAAIQFAQLDGAPPLAASDFIVV